MVLTGQVWNLFTSSGVFYLLPGSCYLIQPCLPGKQSVTKGNSHSLRWSLRVNRRRGAGHCLKLMSPTCLCPHGLINMCSLVEMNQQRLTPHMALAWRIQAYSGFWNFWFTHKSYLEEGAYCYIVKQGFTFYIQDKKELKSTFSLGLIIWKNVLLLQTICDCKTSKWCN